MNVRSLNAHKKDVEIDNVLMTSDIFSLGETHLKIGQIENFVDYNDWFANYGKGKGVCAFSKINSSLLHKIEFSSYSAIHLRTSKFDCIFLLEQ